MTRLGIGAAAIGRIPMRMISFVVLLLTLAPLHVLAQFSGGVQGSVADASGAAEPKATVTLVDTEKNVSRTATTDASGFYRFVSLPPSHYKVAVTLPGFAPAAVEFVLQTAENRDVPLRLKVASASTTVTVTSQAPLLDTSDSRYAMTLNSDELEALPNRALSPLAAIDLAPGVNGSAGAPDNFEQENYLSFGANGRGENGNLAVLDGMSVNSDIRGGVINTTPNLDAIQEVAVQTDTYAVDYGTASSIEVTMTTKSGSSEYHGSGSMYYQYEKLNARGFYGPPIRSRYPRITPATCRSPWVGRSFPTSNSSSSFHMNHIGISLRMPAAIPGSRPRMRLWPQLPA